LLLKSSKIFRATSTAADGTETFPSPILVSLRTRLETSNAWWNNRLRTRPVVPCSLAAAYACLIWLTI
jgi:hypothetical protein